MGVLVWESDRPVVAGKRLIAVEPRGRAENEWSQRNREPIE